MWMSWEASNPPKQTWQPLTAVPAQSILPPKAPSWREVGFYLRHSLDLQFPAFPKYLCAEENKGHFQTWNCSQTHAQLHLYYLQPSAKCRGSVSGGSGGNQPRRALNLGPNILFTENCLSASGIFVFPGGRYSGKGAWGTSGAFMGKGWPGPLPSEGYSIFDIKKHRGIKYLLILYWKEMVVKGLWKDTSRMWETSL